MSEQNKNFDYWNLVEQWPGWLEEIVHDPEGDVWEDELVIDQITTLGCFLSMHPPSIDDVDRMTRWLTIVRFSLSPRRDDWRWTTIFKTLNKISDKNGRIIIDSESCINRFGWLNLDWMLVSILNHIKWFGWTMCPLTLKKDVLSWSNLQTTRTKFSVMSLWMLAISFWADHSYMT